MVDGFWLMVDGKILPMPILKNTIQLDRFDAS